MTVDDNELFIESLTEELRWRGLNCECYTDLDKALTRLCSQPITYKLLAETRSDEDTNPQTWERYLMEAQSTVFNGKLAYWAVVQEPKYWIS